MKELLKEFPAITEIKVRWGEMDAANHVNNVMYFRWAETARFEYFEKLNIPVVPNDKGIGLILGWQDCKYILPIVYPDTVFIGTRIKSFEKDRFYMESHFFSEKYQRLAAITQHRIVCYNYATRSKVDVPKEIKKVILENEKKHPG
jgi:acyl-CoA thioester hydrolase